MAAKPNPWRWNIAIQDSSIIELTVSQVFETKIGFTQDEACKLRDALEDAISTSYSRSTRWSGEQAFPAPVEGVNDPKFTTPWSERGKCGCWDCSQVYEMGMPTVFIICGDCGNKRCPKATNHVNACSGSNATGQPGSRFENFGRSS